MAYAEKKGDREQHTCVGVPSPFTSVFRKEIAHMGRRVEGLHRAGLDTNRRDATP
jgi:hypothetical protein